MKTTTTDTISTEQAAIVRRMKGLDSQPQSRPDIAITHADGTVLGSLVPIDRTLVNDQQVVDRLTVWRQRFMEFFMTQFPATPQRTGRWLREVVLGDDTRLLFMIRDDTGQWVGSIGVCHLSSHTAEMDNVIRGVKGGHPRLMFHAELALMRWLFRVLGVETVRLRVFDHNRAAIRLYDSAGFARRQTLPLGIEQTEAMTRYFANPDPHHRKAEIQLTEMAMDRNEFFARHTWLEE